MPSLWEYRTMSTRSPWTGANNLSPLTLVHWRRKMQLNLEARIIVGHLDADAMQIGDGGDQAEAEPIARAAAAAFEAIEALEGLLALAGRNAGAAVGDP